MSLSGLDPEVQRRVDALIRFSREFGVRIIVTSGFRSFAQQQRLFAKRQRGEHPLPVAPPGQSTHQFGLAVDLVPEPISELPLVAALAECVGLKWAGPGDPVHFDPFGPVGWREVLRGRFPDVRYVC